jgi:hypothetical protein
MGEVPNGVLALCGALCAECYKQFLIALAKVVILLRPSRSMDLCERIMGVKHDWCETARFLEVHAPLCYPMPS